MKKLSDNIIQFFHNQSFVIVSTIDKEGALHNSCKGIVKINPNGRIYLLDLYRGKTCTNLEYNPHISITAVDEHKFVGYCLKGKAETIKEIKLTPQIMKAWEERISGRITRSVLKNIREEKGHPHHPEAFLPKPDYMIVMETEEIVELTPQHLR
mgnify:CR=1 FL=1